jgi:hypothetical protein
MQRMAYASQGSHLEITYDPCQQCLGRGRTPDYRHRGPGQSNGLLAALSIAVSIIVCFKLSLSGFYLDLDLGWKLMMMLGVFFSAMVVAGTFFSLPIVRKAIILISIFYITVAVLLFLI